MKVTATGIPGLMLLETAVYRDARGYFLEAFRRDALAEAGIDIDWRQDNISLSAKNVIRGLHYQLNRPQAKLIQVAHGAVFDVAVDIRRSSPTFGQHVGIELRAGEGKALMIPAGFAHGFCALADDTTFLYKVSDSYWPQGDRTILWNDSELSIAWPVKEHDALISEKDRRGVPFHSAELFD